MRLLFLDIETTGLDWKTEKLHGVGYGLEEDDTEYVSACQLWAHDFKYWLADPEVAKIGHNVRFDLRFLHKAGFEVKGPIIDTMLLAQAVDENQPLGLKDLVAKYLGKDGLSEKRELDRAISMADLRHVGELCALDLTKGGYFDIISRYCEEDVNNTIALFNHFTKLFEAKLPSWKTALGVTKTPLDYLKDEALRVEPALLRMEVRGIRINQEAVVVAQVAVAQQVVAAGETIRTICKDDIAAIEEDLYAKACAKRKSEKGRAKVLRSDARYGTKFNLSSGTHLGQLIYEDAGCPAESIRRTKGGAYSTADGDLAALKSELPAATPLIQVLESISMLRGSQKLQTTYTAPDSALLGDMHEGRVFSNYLQAGSSKDGGAGGTVTGRLSSRAPNMQNLPRGGLIKQFFVPDSEDYVFSYFDYSQVELRIAAHLSKDEELVSAYRRGADLHTLTASGIFRTNSLEAVSKEQRQVAKVINFAMIYDASAWRLHAELGPLGYSLEQVEDMRKTFFQKYSRYREFLRETLKFVQEKGCVTSETGRIRRLPDISYGEGLNWATKRLDVSPAMYEALRNYPAEKLDPTEAFWRANKKYKHAQKQAYNFPIQSLGASITKRAMIELHRKGFDLVSQVHDSIVIQLHKNELDKAQEIRHIMEKVYPLSVPLIAEGKLIKSLDEGDLYKKE